MTHLDSVRQPPYASYPSVAPAPVPPARRWVVPVVLVVVALALAGTGVGVWWSLREDPPPVVETFVIRGGLVLFDSHTGTDLGTPCTGTGAYSDIDDGIQVTISDEDGTTIALGELEDGQVGQPGRCRFPFNVAGVPAGKRFYGVSIGRRGTMRYAEADVRKTLEMTLG